MKKILSSISLFLLSLLVSCQLNPETSVVGTWENIEYITTTLGTECIVYTQTFSSDGVYDIYIVHPTTGTEQQQYIYTTGYQSPKYAIVLHDIADPQSVIGLPIFYYFEGGQLVTSTNSNMALPKKWNKI